MKKPFPKFKNEQEYIEFVENTDLGEYLESSDFIRFDDFVKKIMAAEKKKTK